MLLALSLAAAPPAAAQQVAPLLKPGTYAMQMSVATRARVVVIGDVETTNRQLLLVTLEDRDGTLWQNQTLCAIAMETNTRMGKPVLPPSFKSTIPKRSFPVSLSPEGNGWRYDAHMGRHRSGWDPAVTDAMPLTADHPAVRDSDGDGHPGVTIQLDVPLFGLVDLYVVQDVDTWLSGQVFNGGVQGFAELPVLEQAALGASHQLFASTPRAVPITASSPFSLTPVAQGSTCEALKARYW